MLGVVEFALKPRKGLEAPDGKFDHRLDPLFRQAVDDIGRHPGVDRRAGRLGIALVDEPPDRPRQCTRNGTEVLEPVADWVYELEHARAGARCLSLGTTGGGY